MSILQLYHFAVNIFHEENTFNAVDGDIFGGRDLAKATIHRRMSILYFLHPSLEAVLRRPDISYTDHECLKRVRISSGSLLPGEREIKWRILAIVEHLDVDLATTIGNSGDITGNFTEMPVFLDYIQLQ